jgi:hypothetical protein
VEFCWKYLGVLMLMACYVVMMFGLSYLLWMGGQRVLAASWMLLAYPMVRYAIYAAIAMAVATLVHPVSWASLCCWELRRRYWFHLKTDCEYGVTLAERRFVLLIPSTQFLSEERFLNIGKRRCDKRVVGTF